MLSLIFYESSLIFPYNSILVMKVFITYKLKKLINFHVLFITEKIRKKVVLDPRYKFYGIV